MSLIIGLISALLGVPGIRSFLVDVTVGLGAEILAHPNVDPAFKTGFTSLASQLATAQTEEDKRAILQKIAALRGTAHSNPA